MCIRMNISQNGKVCYRQQTKDPGHTIRSAQRTVHHGNWLVAIGRSPFLHHAYNYIIRLLSDIELLISIQQDYYPASST